MKSTMIRPLLEIGFSALECEIYLTLLRQSDLTGYRIAQVLGKPVPNIYNALESLQKKGVVLSSRKGKSKRYSVLPLHEYLDQLESDLKAKRKRIERGLRALKPSPLQEDVYRIDNIEQFYQRAIRMMNEAQEVVAVDACPEPLRKIRESLVGISKKAARVILKIYKPEGIPGCDTIVYDISGTVFERWPVDWLHIFVDGREYIMGLVDKEEGKLLQAVWSNSPYLSMMAYNGFMCEFVLSHLLTMPSDASSGERLLERVEEYRPLFIQNLAAINRFIAAFGKSDQHNAYSRGDD